MWFFEQWQPNTPTFTVGSSLRIDGPLDAGVLERAFTAVANRHGALRTGFAERGAEPAQVVRATAEVPFRYRDLTDLDAPRRTAVARTLAEEEVRRPLPLREGRPLRVLLIRLGRQEHLLVLSVHHIVCDGRSIADVLLADLSAAYAALESGRPWPEAAAPQFVDFAADERRRWDAGELRRTAGGGDPAAGRRPGTAPRAHQPAPPAAADLHRPHP